jgi:parallel beta-helix repeat protein
MNNIKKIKLAAAITAGITLVGCGSSSDDDPIFTASGYEIPSNAIFVAADAEDGADITVEINKKIGELTTDSVLVLPEGNFKVSDTIILTNGNGITVTGYGKNQTKLDFSTSTKDDGIRFDGGIDITIRDLGVYEAPKNGIKADGANGVHIVETAAVWETPLTEGGENNGAYGLYPVSSYNVLMENNYSKGSADAGIYVGQSNNIVVRNNIAEHNVAGIEIENSTNADVYNNEAFDNTAGILSFDLPNLTQAYGGGVRIFNNNTHDNNTENVGAGAVSLAPAGTGILIFATSNVEIYNNTISGNATAGVEVASYFLADENLANYETIYADTITKGWSPLIKNINIHDNTFTDNSLLSPPKTGLLEQIVLGYQHGANSTGTAQTAPAIIYGGIGELLANAGLLAGFDTDVIQSAIDDGVDHGEYETKDLICAQNNINNNTEEDDELNTGLVYGTNHQEPSNWNDDFTAPEATLLISLMENNALLDCTLPGLDAATVSFKGKDYGCTSDDIDEAACAL